ncbi:hypothetical protein ACOMHN_000435 [Nucella lapillus]
MEMDAQQFVWSVGRWVGRAVLGLAVVTFLLQWLLPKLRKWYSHLGSPSRPNWHAEPGSEEWRKKQESLRQELQEVHQAKAAKYKEQILKPREEAKQQQKEEEFYKFLGPTWKGKGHVLGNDEDQKAAQKELDEFEQDLNPREMAAVRRRIQKPMPQPAQPPPKSKRVITLPEEPLEGDPNSVLVLLRSPIQTTYRRRFRPGDEVQTLLDFMTVSGFSQAFNTLCTSWPRHDLAKDTHLTLEELGFTGRITLNIEEKDL